MPRYDFQCQECSYTFEEERPFEDDSTPPCPQCGKETEKLIAPPAIHFKGEGFFNTDRLDKEKKAKQEKPFDSTQGKQEKEDIDKKANNKKPKNPKQQNPNPNSNIQK